MHHSARRRAVLAVATIAAAAAALLTGCSSQGDASRTIHVTFITKDPNDPYWFAMLKGANATAKKDNVQITKASGQNQNDTAGQIQAIQNAISRGDDAIVIANNGPAVNNEIKKAEKAGLMVIAADTPTTPTNLVATTYATDNFKAAQTIGKWTADKLGGKKAVIAMIDLFANQVVSIDLQRDHGFLSGMGIPYPNMDKNGNEKPNGRYSKGDYTVVCHQYSNGDEDDGRSAMAKCLALNPSINVVYTANEPSALGAYQALKAAGDTSALVTSINGSCDGIKAVASGQFGADAQQFPANMGSDSITAVVNWVRHHKKPAAGAMIDTGSALVTDQPMSGLSSITSKSALSTCY